MATITTCQVPRCTWPADLLTPMRVNVPWGGELELLLCPLHADEYALWLGREGIEQVDSDNELEAGDPR